MSFLNKNLMLVIFATANNSSIHQWRRMLDRMQWVAWAAAAAAPSLFPSWTRVRRRSSWRPTRRATAAAAAARTPTPPCSSPPTSTTCPAATSRPSGWTRWSGLCSCVCSRSCLPATATVCSLFASIPSRSFASTRLHSWVVIFDFFGLRFANMARFFTMRVIKGF